MPEACCVSFVKEMLLTVGWCGSLQITEAEVCQQFTQIPLGILGALLVFRRDSLQRRGTPKLVGFLLLFPSTNEKA